MLVLNIEKVIITSSYGYREYYYQGKLVKGFHQGIDLVCDPRNNNAEVIAFEDGEVIDLSNEGKQYGNPCYVKIKHKNNMTTLYYHLKSGSIKVNKNDKIKKGQVLGIIGATGQATGIHLHFQINDEKGNSINPYDYLFKNKKLIDSKDDNKEKRTYKTLGTMYLRTNAGYIYPKKLVKEMSEDGKKHATSNNPNAFAVYKKDTVFTALEIINNQYGTWARTPSGYICIKGQSGTVYCK